MVSPVCVVTQLPRPFYHPCDPFVMQFSIPKPFPSTWSLASFLTEFPARSILNSYHLVTFSSSGDPCAEVRHPIALHPKGLLTSACKWFYKSLRGTSNKISTATIVLVNNIVCRLECFFLEVFPSRSSSNVSTFFLKKWEAFMIVIVRGWYHDASY